jgi:GNAT superfamily N-acetyltransferase
MVIRQLRVEDVPTAQALMADTWSNLLKQQTGLDLSYPVRQATWYTSRLRHEPLGCICAEENGKLIATGFALSCGNIGWIGPMEVSPVHQGKGYGSQILLSLETYLSTRGCKAVGLETMKDISRNLDFYSQAGYTVEQDVLFLEKDWLDGQDAGHPEKGKADAKEIRTIASTINPGFDPSSEFKIYEEMGIGRTLTAKGAVALLLTDPIPGSGKAYLRTVLTEGYHRIDEAIGLVQKAEREALWSGARTVFTIIPAQSELLTYLIRGGYKPKGADVRMMKGKFARSHECSIYSWSG